MHRDRKERRTLKFWRCRESVRELRGNTTRHYSRAEHLLRVRRTSNKHGGSEKNIYSAFRDFLPANHSGVAVSPSARHARVGESFCKSALPAGIVWG